MPDDERPVTIALFDTVWEASIARGTLENIGIRALVPEERAVRSARSHTGSLQVLESDRDRALTELHRFQVDRI